MAVAKKNPLFANVKFTNKDEVFKRVTRKSPVESFIDAVEAQIKLVEYYMDPKDKEKPKTRAWFEKNNSGVHTVFRYGTLVFPLLDGQKETDTVTVPSYADLLELYQNIQAVSEEPAFKKRIDDAAEKMVKIRALGVERKKKEEEEKAKKEKETSTSESE